MSKNRNKYQKIEINTISYYIITIKLLLLHCIHYPTQYIPYLTLTPTPTTPYIVQALIYLTTTLHTLLLLLLPLHPTPSLLHPFFLPLLPLLHCTPSTSAPSTPTPSTPT